MTFDAPADVLTQNVTNWINEALADTATKLPRGNVLGAKEQGLVGRVSALGKALEALRGGDRSALPGAMALAHRIVLIAIVYELDEVRSAASAIEAACRAIRDGAPPNWADLDLAAAALTASSHVF